MAEIVFACEPEELSCIIGNLFSDIEPPCGIPYSKDLTICGTTYSEKCGRLVIQRDRCLFYGSPDDLEAARCGPCPERRCERGR